MLECVDEILILQHIAIEHPGILLDFFREDGFRWTTVELDEGGTIPELDPFDLMVVMGGPQDVWQEDQYSGSAKKKQPFENSCSICSGPISASASAINCWRMPPGDASAWLQVGCVSRSGLPRWPTRLWFSMSCRNYRRYRRPMGSHTGLCEFS